MGAILVHIDLDGDRPHPSSLAALSAARMVASSWGATLYAALIVQVTAERGSPDSTGHAVAASRFPGLENVQAQLAQRGADKIVVALSDTAVHPLWCAIGEIWQGVLDHLRPRLVVFGADSPAAAELGPRTGARLGARLLVRARAVGIADVELRDRDGGYARSGDGGAAVVLVGGAAALTPGDDDVDVVVLTLHGTADARIELAGTVHAEAGHAVGAMVALGDDAATDATIANDAAHVATLLGAPLVGSAAAARALASGAVLERNAPVAPEVCVVIGTVALDIAGATSLVRIGSTGGKHVDGALAAPIGGNLADLRHTLETLAMEKSS